MNDDPRNKPQVNVELPSAFGGKKFQQIAHPDTRINPAFDFNRYLLNQLIVPGRAVDIAADILIWVAASSFIASVGNQLIKLPGVTAIAGVLLALAVFLSIYIYKITQLSRIRWSLFYRWLLIVIGVFLGVR